MLKHKYCRICMIATTANKFYRIFETVRDNCLVANILAQCANISVEIEDRLPQIVCPTCMDNLIEFWNFRKMIKTTNRNLIGMLWTELVEEPDPKIKIKVIDESSEDSLKEDEDEIFFDSLKLPESEKLGDADGLINLKVANTALQQMEIIDASVRIELIEVLDLKDVQMECEVPSKASTEKRGKHIKTVVEKQIKPIQILHYCCMCPVKCDKEAELLEHVKTAHHEIREKFAVMKFYEETTYRCDLCFKVLKKPESVVLHRNRFKLAMQCESCGKFILPKGVQWKSIHTCSCYVSKNPIIKLEECPICHITCKNKKKHMSDVHEGKTWECKLCPTTLHSRCAYTSHMQRHEIKKLGKFKCNFPGCDFMLYEPYRKRHMRSHTKETPYDCQYCEKKFTEYIDRKRHEWTHTGISPYMCSKCNKMFFRKSHLLKHETNCKIVAV